jgi:hypothetical protein
MNKPNTDRRVHETAIAEAKAATRKRANWGYVELEALEDYAKTLPSMPDENGNAVLPAADDVLARRLFGVRLDAPVQRKGTLFAVWRRDGEPDTEPQFDGPPQETKVDFSKLDLKPPPEVPELKE